MTGTTSRRLRGAYLLTINFVKLLNDVHLALRHGNGERFSNMSLGYDYRERARECLALAQSTQNPQTRIWAAELAALLQRLSQKTGNHTYRGSLDRARSDPRREGQAAPVRGRGGMNALGSNGKKI